MANDIFPRYGDGFCADVESGDFKLRLFSSVLQAGWAACVYDLKAKRWIKEEIWADDADDSKNKAQEFASSIPGVILKLPLNWYPCPKR